MPSNSFPFPAPSHYKRRPTSTEEQQSRTAPRQSSANRKYLKSSIANHSPFPRPLSSDHMLDSCCIRSR